MKMEIGNPFSLKLHITERDTLIEMIYTRVLLGSILRKVVFACNNPN